MGFFKAIDAKGSIGNDVAGQDHFDQWIPYWHKLFYNDGFELVHNEPRGGGQVNSRSSSAPCSSLGGLPSTTRARESCYPRAPVVGDILEGTGDGGANTHGGRGQDKGTDVPTWRDSGHGSRTAIGQKARRNVDQFVEHSYTFQSMLQSRSWVVPSAICQVDNRKRIRRIYQATRGIT